MSDLMLNERESKLDILVKARKAPRFKAGSDLSGKVNRVDVDFDEQYLDDSQSIELKVTIVQELECNINPCD